MEISKVRAARWPYLVLATVTSLVVLAGASLLLYVSQRATLVTQLNDEEGPYTSYFFYAYSLVNLIFLILLAISAYQLFRRRLTGLSLLRLTLKLELAYWLLVYLMWTSPGPLGASAAGASGIGNAGIAPQIFIAYPITGLLAVWILGRSERTKADAYSTAERTVYPARIAYRVFGMLTAFFVVFGSFALLGIGRVVPAIDLNDGEGPYTSHFFYTFSCINLVFLILLALSAFWLLRFNSKGISLLTLILLVELVYFLAVPYVMSYLPEHLGMSAAGAWGIGNAGIAPQVLIAYPITGPLAVVILKRLKMLSVQPAMPTEGA